MSKLIEKKIKYLQIFIVLVFMLVYSFSCMAVELSENENYQNGKDLNWLSFDQALTKSKIENIPTLIYFYSDNCEWCRRLEDETFKNQEVKELMNGDFAIVKINSNSSNVVSDKGEITEKQLSQEFYQVRANPTIWFLSSNEERIAPLPGYAPAEDFISVLHYIRDGYYRDYTFPEYMEEFN
jgi:thioredoxin-related protein